MPAAPLWLQVRDVYATEKELADRGVAIAREARQEPWGLHEMHVIDPDGVTLIFVQVPETIRCAATPGAERVGQRAAASGQPTEPAARRPDGSPRDWVPCR